jgi:hypothetical protein
LNRRGTGRPTKAPSTGSIDGTKIGTRLFTPASLKTKALQHSQATPKPSGGGKMNKKAELIVFDNQNILPAQFFPHLRDDALMAPFRRLALAVLVDAVHVFQTNFDDLRPRRKREFIEAREWLLGPPGRGPFAFENVCFLVGIVPSQLRSWLGRLQALNRSGLLCGVLARRSTVQRRLSLRSRLPQPAARSRRESIPAKCRTIHR